ncbi:hypothetical protein K488DRAFT_75272, partial [Vararia minispora EC-137]
RRMKIQTEDVPARVHRVPPRAQSSRHQLLNSTHEVASFDDSSIIPERGTDFDFSFRDSHQASSPDHCPLYPQPLTSITAEPAGDLAESVSDVPADDRFHNVPLMHPTVVPTVISAASVSSVGAETFMRHDNDELLRACFWSMQDSYNCLKDILEIIEAKMAVFDKRVGELEAASSSRAHENTNDRASATMDEDKDPGHGMEVFVHSRRNSAKLKAALRFLSDLTVL